MSIYQTKTLIEESMFIKVKSTFITLTQEDVMWGANYVVI